MSESDETAGWDLDAVEVTADGSVVETYISEDGLRVNVYYAAEGS